MAPDLPTLLHVIAGVTSALNVYSSDSHIAVSTFVIRIRNISQYTYAVWASFNGGQEDRHVPGEPPLILRDDDVLLSLSADILDVNSCERTLLVIIHENNTQPMDYLAVRPEVLKNIDPVSSTISTVYFNISTSQQKLSSDMDQPEQTTPSNYSSSSKQSLFVAVIVVLLIALIVAIVVIFFMIIVVCQCKCKRKKPSSTTPVVQRPRSSHFMHTAIAPAPSATHHKRPNSVPTDLKFAAYNHDRCRPPGEVDDAVNDS